MSVFAAVRSACLSVSLPTAFVLCGTFGLIGCGVSPVVPNSSQIGAAEASTATGATLEAARTTRINISPTIVMASPTPALPLRNKLLGEYLLTEGSGTIAHDTSGQGNDALIHAPVWESNLDLDFPQAGSFIQMPTALNNTRTWQIAFFNPPFGSAVLPQMPGYGGPQTTFPGTPSLLCGSDTSHLCLRANSIFTRSHRFYAANTDLTEAADAMPPGWHVLTFVCGFAAGLENTPTHILYDGTEANYISQGTNTCPAPASGNYQVGGSAAYYQTMFIGKIAAVWAWHAMLSVDQASQAARYAMNVIADRGIQTRFSDVVNSTPVILGGLDSRTAGTGVTASTVWLQQMVLDDNSYVRRNLAQSGATVYDNCVMFDATYGEQIGTSGQPVITMLWGGVNDGAESPQQIADGLHCMVGKAKAKGSRVILATEISAYSKDGNVADYRKKLLNRILRAQAFEWGADSLADLATDPRLGAAGASADPTCFPDGLHPGPGCEPNITSIMQNAVNELIGASAANHHSTAAGSYQELAGDGYLDLTGPGGQQVTLPSCIGYSLPRQINNLGPGDASIVAQDGQMLVGDGVLAAMSTATVLPVPGFGSTGGCSWSRTQ